MSSLGTAWGAAVPSRRRRGTRFAALAGVLIPVVAIVAFFIVAITSHASVTVAPQALARLQLPFGGGSVERLSVTGGREQKLVGVALRGDQIWPTSMVIAGERLTVDVTIKRPGWISWLAGGTERVRLTIQAPTSSVRSPYLTVTSGHLLELAFRQPVRVVEYGTGRSLTRHVLGSPVTTYPLHVTGAAGTLSVAAAPRSWETPKRTFVSWFPAGAAATAVANPAPGTSISPTTKITLTFSKPVAKVLGSTLPPVSPGTPGTWHAIDSHTIQFVPEGYGYGLGASVTVGLPSGVSLVGGISHGSDPIGKWTVPAGSTLRLQQLLAMTGYLPLNFSYAGAGVKPTLAGEVAAAIKPPAGSFSWSYSSVPSSLRSMWAPGTAGVMTRGAVMAFENAQGLTPDGVAGPAVWKALIAAAMKGTRSTFGYTFVMVSEGSPESIDVWHNGRTVVSGPVNTGVAAAPTATGVFPVFEHLPVTTMTGTNPDGSHYSDPGIPWVSYFNGGDALHGFIRASYGFPQSDGCVEMPYAQAGRVYPYTPIGTLVDVA